MHFRKLKVADQDSSNRPDAKEIKDGQTSAEETAEEATETPFEPTQEGYPQEIEP